MRSRPATRPSPPPERPPIPATHPALVGAALAVAAFAVVVVTFPIGDPDLWQHLTVGRRIWELHAVPDRHLWTWPSYGQPEVLPSWLFRALLWPVWERGGVIGLFVWRWLTTLATLALGWAAARRMGARGAAPLVAVALGVMVYRGRTMVRPETLTAPLFAATLLLLEWRRRGGRMNIAGRDLDPALALAPLAWVWANAHISYWLLFFTAGAYALDSLAGEGARGDVRSRPRTLVAASLAAAALALVNPFGWRTLAQPFEYFLFWRNEPIFQTIGELRPVFWNENLRNGLPLLLVAWPLLALRRMFIGRRDLAELALCATLVALTLGSQRFMGPLAIASIPFLGRDLSELAAGSRGPLGDPRPWPRVALALAAVALIATPLLLEARSWFGVRLDLRDTPVGACDFVEHHGIRGHFYNVFWQGGYLLWRFWPDRGRLPFIDAHVAGTRADRDAAAFAPDHEEAWQALDRRRHFEVIIAPRYKLTDLGFLERRDADSAWALVFVDDGAAVYLRREVHAFAPVIERSAYRLVSAGSAGLEVLYPRAVADTAVRAALVRELDRAIAESSASSRSHFLRGIIAEMDQRFEAAASDFRAAIAADPDMPRAHAELGAAEAAVGRHREAIAEYLREANRFGMSPGLPARVARSYRALGDLGAARRWYERDLKSDPGDTAARDSLAAIAGASR